ncbi:glycosyltransferase family protein [Rhodohalobacter sp. 614A]|uniref:glycosyltransferase family protein n=1 Tax=Rhodohalobacter sp. 614A TaxID=2908649 RepID=UPI001F1D63CC|nr:glycosyltransferase [Rhodohalobacter sp. 614A]
MKVFQCIHKYPPHIPAFEKKYKIKNRDLSFNEIRELLIQDGYASTYILKPALESITNEVFFTLWDYERLQYQWAEEQHLQTKDLDEIKLAQIETFKPDVFYNHSPRYDNNFVQKLAVFENLKKICWDAVAAKYPLMHEKYDARVTLFKPHVKYWKSKGLNASILPPAYVPSWEKYLSEDREIDVLFYGQCNEKFFSNRNQIIAELLKWQSTKKYNVKVHIQGINKKYPLFDVKGLRRFTKWINKTPKPIKKYALGPIYGQALYKAIGNSKIVVNASGNYNGVFKDNMRIYEALGVGALMIGEEGVYPDFIEPDKDFLTFRNAEELITKIEDSLSEPTERKEKAKRAHEKLKMSCSKEIQWNNFCDIVTNLKN